ncbi:Pleckstrin homology domain-containing protein [Pisolithus albus]|nr:Pleckstrin homology domain-containing protein [Pisolithus albus]
MPEKMFSVADDVGETTFDQGGDAEDSTLSRAMDNHAFHFFVRQGGKLEDWNDDRRADIRTELVRRWRESGWIRPSHRQSRTAIYPTHWAGCSFEIGNVLGVNILDKHTLPVSNARTAQVPDQVAAAVMPSSTASMHATTPACLPSLPPDSDHALLSLPEGSSNHNHSSSSALLPSASFPALMLERPMSRTEPLVARGDRPGEAVQSETTIESRNANETIRPGVHFPDNQVVDDPQLEGTSVSQGDLTPSGDGVVENGAESTSTGPRPFGADEIVLRDRMFVRISHTPLEGLSRNFDEVEHRHATMFKEEGWAEFLVVWRGSRMEIYDDYTLPGREFFTGHKKLAFLIPLSSSRTNVSLYSFADLTFCVHCPSTLVHNEGPKAKTLFRIPKEGTNVFIFKHKSRTRAEDWLWHLWHRLRCRIPPSIEISYPTTDSHLRIDVPLGDTANIDEVYRVFSVNNIVETVLQSVAPARGVPGIVFFDWNYIRQDLQGGKRLELVWRLEDQLEWIWQPTDVEGNDRRWLVLCGLSLKQVRKAPHLEIRTVDHRREFVQLPGGTKMEEPPGVEGYLDRIKERGHRQRVYVSTHDGSLFALSPNDANPPAPPSTHLSHMVGSLTDANQYAEVIFRNEIERGVTQIRSAYGVMDLWNIQSVRAVLQEAQQAEPDNDPSIDADEGGVAGLAKAQNPLKLRLMRSFEIVLVSGRVIRLEAYSCRNCREWIDKLQALITYWTRRHKEFAELEMDISDTINRRPRVTPRLPSSTTGEAPQDPEASLPSLTSLYRWCTLSDCRSVIRSGRVFMRRGFRGQYKMSHLVLVSGHLIPFHVRRHSTLHRRRRRQISLLDAYIYSGYLAALTLPREEFNPSHPTPPRRYCDGVEADEPVEDILFMLWYRKARTSSAGGQASGIPPSSAKFKTVTFKTRNKIEKTVRRNREREERLRQMGTLVNMSHR